MAPRSLQFSSFTLDLDRLCLRGPDGEADLRPKSFEVLRYLVEHPGRVVGKEEAIKAVWPDVTVTDESLTRCISEVRRAIADESQQLIKTVPRRGYLLDVPVSEVITATDVPASGPRVAGDPAHSANSAPKDDIDESALAGERKHVTVLYADLRESLEVAAQRDPEEAMRLLEAVLDLMTEAVHRYEGRMNLTTGDGIMALFGAPVAHEDHAVRACYAALQLQAAVKRYAREPKRASTIPILVRAGLSSGEVVVRSVANDPPTQYRAIGRTTLIAMRLGQAATSGTSLVNGETLRLAEGYIRVKTVEPVHVAGLGEAAYELIGAGAARTRFQVSAARGLTGFVGRAVEIEQLERVWAKAQSGQGQVVAIIGEPGLGKSRLVYEFISSHPQRRWLVLECACVSFGTGTSWLPVIELLRSYFNIEVSDDVREMRDKIADKIDQALVPDLPAFMALLDIPVEEASWSALDAFQRRQRTLDALKRLVLLECHRQPVMLVCEDLHWIDRETQAILETLIDGLASAPLLLVLTYRPEYEHRWGSRSNYTQLRLDTLSTEATKEFLSKLLGDDASLISLKSPLPTGGTPFFLEETVRALVEAGLLHGTRGDYVLSSPLQEVRIPASVQSILAARIDRLSSRHKRLLQAAAVVGKDVPHAILQGIAGLQEDELRRGLTKLREAEFLYESRLFPDLEFSFKHALTHEVAYGSLLADDRTLLHRQIVGEIERRHGDRLAEQVEQLAHHAVHGELWEKAVSYLRQAGNKAATRSAVHDARAWFEQALSAIQRLPENQSTLEQGFGIRLELRSVLLQLGEARQMTERLREAEIIAEKLNDDRRRGQVCAFMANAHILLGAPDEALVTGARALEIAGRLQDLRLRILTTSQLEQGNYHRGEYRRVIELATENLAALPDDWVYETFGSTMPGSVLDRFFLITSLAELGSFAEAARYETEAIRLAEAAKNPHAIGVAHWGAGMLHIAQGDWADARRLLDRGVETFRTGSFSLIDRMLASSAWVLAELDAPSEALDRLHESEQRIERLVASGYAGLVNLSYHALGRASLRLGRLDEARRFGERARQTSPHHHGIAAWAMHLLGEIATHPDRFDAETGETYYRHALGLAEPRAMRPLVAHCHRGLGALFQQIGERSKAQKNRTMATTVYRELGMRHWPESGLLEQGSAPTRLRRSTQG